MFRSAQHILDRWHQNQKRKPLILRGARQVGKSTLVRQWADEQKLELFEINLERHRLLDDLFKSNNIVHILEEIELIIGRGPISSENSILFLDEIQATPHALATLRYFYEDRPSFAVIAAGSLLEFALNDHQFSMPVGRIEYLFMGPMTFKEYLAARNQHELLKKISTYQWHDAHFSSTLHQQLLSHLRHYLLVGGMPEAVAQHIHDHQNSDQTLMSEEVIASLNNILETYQDDFSKYCRNSELRHLHTVFNQLPASIGKKVKYSNIDADALSRDLKNAIKLLTQSNIIQPVYHTDANGVPLRAEQNAKNYKLYALDIGLINRMSRIEWVTSDELLETRFINEGCMAEQFIAQHLLRLTRHNEKPDLHYWLKEKKQSNAEVDFLWQNNREVVPIEVKAGKSGSLRSLHQFILLKGTSRAVRFDTNPPSSQQVTHQVPTKSGNYTPVEYKLLSLPLYMIEELPRLLRE